LADCTDGDCATICQGIMTVEGAVSEAEGSTEVTEEAEDLVTSDEEIQSESGSSLSITRILTTTYTSTLEFTSTGASTTTVGEDSGAEVEPDYTDETTTTTSSSLIQYIGLSLIAVYMLLFWINIF